MEGALSQTYSPLEIILSDDCSPDRTFEIIQEMIASYSGPHKIILNRNEKNLGLGQHFNRVMDMAKGELIVMAAGDDISLSNRTEDLVNEWISEGRPSGLCSNIINIDESGIVMNNNDNIWIDEYQKIIYNIKSKKQYEIYITYPTFTLLGGAAAWTKECWERFGNINSDVVNEDNVMTFRSILSSRVHISNQKLIKYRRHDSNVSNSNQNAKFHFRRFESPEHYSSDEKKRSTLYIRVHVSLKNMISDISLLQEKSPINNLELHELKKILLNHKKIFFIRANWWNLSIFSKIYYARYLSRDKNTVKILKLLPFNKYCKIRCFLSNFKSQIKSFIFYYSKYQIKKH